ncbi:MAG: NRDE family protein [Gammaproteobacteria bacterium]|nr:MAG: NRDE family protein [Gammaproteobacteria bacterium]
MCLIVLAYRVHPDYPLIVAANRDEFYARPTRAAAFWPDQPQLLAGRDEQSGGSWLGITRHGRFAAVTNVRQRQMVNIGERSRGELVTHFLTGTETPVAFAARIAPEAHRYGAFNLLCLDGDSLICHHSITNETEVLAPGYHGLSNDRLNTPWPKLTRSLQALRRCVETGATIDALQALLQDRARPADHDLPDTGIGLAKEQLLSSPFIHSAEYGTRACTVLRMNQRGLVEFEERSFGPDGIALSSQHHSFTINP